MTQSYEEAHYVARLREEQEKAILETDEKIKKLEQFKSDYMALQTRLKTLPDKVAHEVMVPFGKLAFMPGKLVHTNEILVLLGDNWFAEKSAKQATETVDRRLKVVDEQISDLNKQKGLLKPRLSFTSELEDLAQQKGEMIEIKEEYDPEKEKQWRVEHRKKLQAYNKQRREEEQKAREEFDAKHLQESESDKKLWERLDQLERLEQQGGEMDRLGLSDSNEEEGSSTDTGSESDSEKTIRWKDHNTHKTIHFTHTKNITEENKDTTSPETKITDKSESVSIINSPSDIYKQFVQSQGPKSILKQKEHGHLEVQDTSKENSEKTILPGSVHAFSGEVLERQMDLASFNDNTEDTVQQPPKRVSKFKAQRMAKR